MNPVCRTERGRWIPVTNVEDGERLHDCENVFYSERIVLWKQNPSCHGDASLSHIAFVAKKVWVKSGMWYSEWKCLEALCGSFFLSSLRPVHPRWTGGTSESWHSCDSCDEHKYELQNNFCCCAPMWLHDCLLLWHSWQIQAHHMFPCHQILPFHPNSHCFGSGWHQILLEFGKNILFNLPSSGLAPLCCTLCMQPE